jgi:hypothetical protein
VKYRKKPIVVEAEQIYKGMGSKNWKGLPVWLRDWYEKGNVIFLSDGVQIKTLEGWYKGNIGDWIIKGITGELYPCKPDIFEKTYEKVEV